MIQQILAAGLALLALCAYRYDDLHPTVPPEQPIDNVVYEAMLFPDYIAENPVRYLSENELGKYDGWQDFGSAGEIKTIAQPMRSTYVYQMYAYYIRNDLARLYPDDPLPETVADLPAWLSDTAADGRRALWYSMGQRLPDRITLTHTETITAYSGDRSFLKAEYNILLGETEENWILYFLAEPDTYSVYAVRINEFGDQVAAITTGIVQTYQSKSQP